MALCLKCSKELVCEDCGPSKQVGTIEQSCPGKKGAIWVQVLDDLEAGVSGVSLTNSGAPEETTDGSGFAKFDPLETGSYDLDLAPLGPSHVDKYAIPAEPTRPISAFVMEGEIAFLQLKLLPI